MWKKSAEPPELQIRFDRCWLQHVGAAGDPGLGGDGLHMKALSQIFAARRAKIRYISRPAPRISYSMAHYNGVMWPDRRQILKRTPLLFAAGLTFAALPKIERCSASGSRGYPMGGDPSQPTVAESAGFNENVFYDNFSSPQTV